MMILSDEACKEIGAIAETHATAASQSQNEKWKWYNQGKVDGIETVCSLMHEVEDEDDHYDSRDPAHIFTESKYGAVHFTLQVNESNVNAVVATLIDNKYRVVIKNIYEISANMTTWEIEYWKE